MRPRTSVSRREYEVGAHVARSPEWCWIVDSRLEGQCRHRSNAGEWQVSLDLRISRRLRRMNTVLNGRRWRRARVLAEDMLVCGGHLLS